MRNGFMFLFFGGSFGSQCLGGSFFLFLVCFLFQICVFFGVGKFIFYCGKGGQQGSLGFV